VIIIPEGDPFGDGFNPFQGGAYHGWEQAPLPGETDIREVSGCIDFDPLTAADATITVAVDLEAALPALAPAEGYLDVVVTGIGGGLGGAPGGPLPVFADVHSAVLWASVPAADPLAVSAQRWDLASGGFVAVAGASVWEDDDDPVGRVHVQLPLGALFDATSPNPLQPTEPLGLIVATRLVHGPGDMDVDVAPDPVGDQLLGATALPRILDIGAR